MLQKNDRPWVNVWDPLVRFGHWALVIAFLFAYLSAEEESNGPDQLHVLSGYAVGCIVLLRVAWGVVGTKHARFNDFAYSPMSALQYFGDLLRGKARRHLGHSPIGAAMVFALLISLSATVWTGLVVYGENGKGPLAFSAALATGPAYADPGLLRSEEHEGQREENEESFTGELHGFFANLTLGLIILHIIGVCIACSVHRENLILAMFTGKKRSDNGI
jgi:cytochrome b